MSLSLFAKEELDVWLKNRWQLWFYLRFEINSPQKHMRNPQNESISPQDWPGDARRGQKPSEWALDSWRFWSLSQGRGFVAKIRQRWGRPEMSWWPRTAGQGGVARRRQLITFRQVVFFIWALWSLAMICDGRRLALDFYDENEQHDGVM